MSALRSLAKVHRLARPTSLRSFHASARREEHFLDANAEVCMSQPLLRNTNLRPLFLKFLCITPETDDPTDGNRSSYPFSRRFKTPYQTKIRSSSLTSTQSECSNNELCHWQLDARVALLARAPEIQENGSGRARCSSTQLPPVLTEYFRH